MFFANFEEAIRLVMMPFLSIAAVVSIVTFGFMVLIDMVDEAVRG